MQKLLISTNFNSNSSSDAVGGSLPLVLYANFFKKNFNYEVILHDPFYDSKGILEPFWDEVTSELSVDFNKYDRVINPLFYLGDLIDKKSKKIYNLEGRYSFNKKLNVKKENFQIIQGRGFQKKNSKNSSNLVKSLDVPYTYYYDWLARENFIPNIKLLNPVSLPINNNAITYAIQIRKNNHKKYKDNLIGDDYDELIRKLVLNIKNENSNANIIFYGTDEKSNILDHKLFDFLKQKKCLHLESFSSNPLERAIILSTYTDVTFSTLNGFSSFVKYLGYFGGKLKKTFIINSEKNLEENIHSRRHLSEGILEKYYFHNSFFWKRFTFLKNNQLDNLDFSFKDEKVKKKSQEEKYFIYYDIDKFSKFYFSKKIDKIIFSALISKNKEIFKNHKILIMNKNNLLELNGKLIEKEIDLSLCQHVLTHYNLIKDYDKNEKLSTDSLDFIKPSSLKKLIKEKKINTSNLYYDDLSTFTLRECKKNSIKFANCVTNKILFVDSITKEHNEKINLFKKFLNPRTNKHPKINWSIILENYKEKLGIDCDLLNYQNDDLLEFYNTNEKKNSLFQIENLEKLISNYDTIVCTQNNLSLLIKLLYHDKKIVLLNYLNLPKNTFETNLFFNSNFDYFDVFENRVSNFRELNLYLFNKYIEL